MALVGGSGSAEAQTPWFFCRFCKSLYFAGGGASACSGNGGLGHAYNAEPTYYAVAIASIAGEGFQSGWRYCRKCGELVFSQTVGPCPAKGNHDTSNSVPYVLTNTGSASTGGGGGTQPPQGTKPQISLNIGNDQLIPGVLVLSAVNWSIKADWSGGSVSASGAHTEVTLPVTNSFPVTAEITLSATAAANGYIGGIPFQGNFQPAIKTNPAKVSLSSSHITVGYLAQYVVTENANGNPELVVTISYAGAQ